MKTISLNGTWQVRPQRLATLGEAGLRRLCRPGATWLPACVPGEIHLDLIRAGKMPEPLFSTNAPKCRWPEKYSWWYRHAFRVTPAFLRHERQELIFDGLDLFAQVFLNGKLIGSAANALVPAVFDIKPSLKPGKNELVVRLTCGTELVEGKRLPERYSQGLENPRLFGHRYEMDHKRGWLRKAQCTYGWDWVESLPNIGIWRGVRLEGRSHAVIHDLRLDTDMVGKRVFVKTEWVIENLHAFSERQCILELTIAPPAGQPICRRYPVPAQVGRSPHRDTIEISDPQLWWPNGMGAQPLYHVTARILNGQNECDRREFDYGLRTIRIDQSPLKKGRRFCIQVNGQDVFCSGANWIPADAIMARVDRKRYDHLIAEAKAVNYKMLRVWGGGIYEDDAFYEACDRAGILVWQDFMFACTEYPCFDETFRHAVRAEAEAAVMRLRHHACITLWCGNNENISWFSYGRSGWGTRIYNQVLPDVCRTLDPERFYWPSSPAGGESPVSQREGDAHPWPYTMGPDCNMTAGSADAIEARFVTEFGAVGPTVMDTVRDYLRPEEMKFSSRAWKMHVNVFEGGLTPNAIQYHYMDTDKLTLEQYVRYGTFFQAMIYGQHYESMRFRKHDPAADCAGYLIWMFEDCWGEVGWSIVDYYLRRKPCWYSIRRACRPVKVIVRRRGRQIVTRVVNDRLEKLSARVAFGWRRVDGTDARLQAKVVALPANGMVEIAREPIPPQRDLHPCEWIYGATLAGDGIENDQSTWQAVPFRQLATADPAVSVTQCRNGEIEISSAAYRHMVHAEDHGRPILSDNYFDLLPGVPARVQRVDGKIRAPRFSAAKGNGAKQT